LIVLKKQIGTNALNFVLYFVVFKKSLRNFEEENFEAKNEDLFQGPQSIENVPVQEKFKTWQCENASN